MRHLQTWRFFLFLVSAAGCASTNPSARTSAAPIGNPTARATPGAIDVDYHVGTGDVVQIRTPSMSQPLVAKVQGDGCLHLSAKDRVRVDGLLTTEIAQKLEHDCGPRFRHAQVAVQDFHSQFIHVYGIDGASEPRAVVFRGRESLRDVLVRAGCRPCRQGYRVRVVRQGGTIGAIPEIAAVRLDRDLNNRDGAAPVLLQANDLVYVAKDIGKPGEMTRMTEGHWWNSPSRWFRSNDPKPSSVAGR